MSATFTSTITHISIADDLIVTYGTYVSSGDAEGGDINTGTDRCLFIKLAKLGDAVSTGVPSVDETMPCPGKAVTVVTDANESGIWMAIGEGVGY
jgi:hypothetical protein